MGCVPHAIRAYIERQGVDTSQLIVEMIAPGKSHWYYRSDQFITSKFGERGTDYTGPIEELPENVRRFYDNFREAQKAMEWAQSAVEMGCRKYKEYLGKLRSGDVGALQ